jgi:hypothetical protein
VPLAAAALAVVAVVPIAAQSKYSEPHETTTFRAMRAWWYSTPP